jgi:small subunit ribosomal protein S20
MPNTKTAKKALRQNIKRRQINAKSKKDLKEAIKNFKKLALTDKEKAKKELSAVYKKLDKSAKTKLIKKNKASRLKSRLTKALNKKEG